MKNFWMLALLLSALFLLLPASTAISATPTRSAIVSDGAYTKYLAYKKYTKEAAQFNIRFSFAERDLYTQIRNSIFENQAFQLALKEAKVENIPICLSNKFKIFRNRIEIDVSATPQEIINFLLGT